MKSKRLSLIGVLFLVSPVTPYFPSVSFSFPIRSTVMARLSALSFLLSFALIAASTAEKSDGMAFPGATVLFTKCLAPFNSAKFNLPTPPICSAEEFYSYDGNDLMRMDGKQIGSLPPSYFESLRIEQASRLEASFIRKLGKEQALAFTMEAESALPANSRKVLKKIKKKPGPVARAIIMGLSAATAFIIFKYS